MERISADQLRNGLTHFTGTETWTRHWANRKMTYTDGVAYFAEKAGAYWFLDIVATELMLLQREYWFLVITLTVKGSNASIDCNDGNDDTPDLYSREIEFTDCPEGVWKFYLTDDVMLLPSEY